MDPVRQCSGRSGAAQVLAVVADVDRVVLAKPAVLARPVRVDGDVAEQHRDPRTRFAHRLAPVSRSRRRGRRSPMRRRADSPVRTSPRTRSPRRPGGARCAPASALRSGPDARARPPSVRARCAEESSALMARPAQGAPVRRKRYEPRPSRGFKGNDGPSRPEAAPHRAGASGSAAARGTAGSQARRRAGNAAGSRDAMVLLSVRGAGRGQPDWRSSARRPGRHYSPGGPRRGGGVQTFGGRAGAGNTKVCSGFARSVSTSPGSIGTAPGNRTSTPGGVPSRPASRAPRGSPPAPPGCMTKWVQAPSRRIERTRARHAVRRPRSRGAEIDPVRANRSLHPARFLETGSRETPQRSRDPASPNDSLEPVHRAEEPRGEEIRGAGVDLVR